MPNRYFAKNFVSFISQRLTKSVNFTFTILEGLYLANSSQTNASKTENSERFLLEGVLPTKNNARKNEMSITIGDDVDTIQIMGTPLTPLVPGHGVRGVNGYAKSLSTFLNSDDTYVDIRCKRYSFTTRQTLNTEYWYIYFFFVFAACGVCVFFVSTIYILIMSYYPAGPGMRVVAPIAAGAIFVAGVILKNCYYLHFSHKVLNLFTQPFAPICRNLVGIIVFLILLCFFVLPSFLGWYFVLFD